MITEYLDLKLLVGTLLPEDQKVEMNIEELLKKEKFFQLLQNNVTKDKEDQ
jgi:hypothetical protein